MVPEVNSELNLRVNMFGVSDGSYVLQYERLKNDPLLGVLLPISYVVELHFDG